MVGVDGSSHEAGLQAKSVDLAKVGWLEFNVPFQHKYGYIRDKTWLSVIGDLAQSLHSSDELGELLQWQCYDDSLISWHIWCAILCATIVHSAMHTHMNRLIVLWIGFCVTGPISLCLDSFLYCVLLCVVCTLSFVTRWGRPGGIEAYP